MNKEKQIEYFNIYTSPGYDGPAKEFAYLFDEEVEFIINEVNAAINRMTSDSAYEQLKGLIAIRDNFKKALVELKEKNGN